MFLHLFPYLHLPYCWKNRQMDLLCLFSGKVASLSSIGRFCLVFCWFDCCWCVLSFSSLSCCFRSTLALVGQFFFLSSIHLAISSSVCNVMLVPGMAIAFVVVMVVVVVVVVDIGIGAGGDKS